MTNKHSIATVRQAAADLVRLNNELANVCLEITDNREVILKHLPNIENEALLARLHAVILAPVPDPALAMLLYSECDMVISFCNSIENNESELEPQGEDAA